MILEEYQYRALVKRMTSLEGVAGTLGKRREAEQIYFMHHKALGVKLRKKYRL